MLDFQTGEPIVLGEGEYVYLTDTLEPMTRRDLQNGAAARFVVKSRQEVLQSLVRCVLQQELTQAEQTAAQLLFIGSQSVSETARRMGLSRKQVYTLSDRAEQKLRAYLKYPFLLDFNLLAPPNSFGALLKQYGGMQ